MDFNSILSQLGMKSKNTVYLSVTPGIGLELIQLDTASRSVKNYAFRPLNYNESLREIADYEAFRDAVSELFEELKLDFKSNVVVNLPMVLFGDKELPVLLGDEAVTEALTSEVEQSYVFKRHEPSIAWADANNSQSGDMRKLFYTALQKEALENIKNALEELGATLAGVDISLMSLLRALDFSGLAEQQMKDNISWNLMLITSSGYSVVSMIGKNIIDYYDEPMAIKSLDGNEIYNAINASAQITLMNYPANYLYIISETDLVSAELLASRMPADNIVNYWDNNAFKKQDALPVSLEVIEDTARKISLEAIGIAAPDALPFNFNFLSSLGIDSLGIDPNAPVHIVFGSKEFDISPNAAAKLALIFALIILVPVIGAFIGVPMIVKQKQALLDDVNSRLSQTQSEIKKLQEEQNKTNNFDVNSEIKKVLGTNRAKLLSYTALGDSVPKNLWITYFVAKDDGKIDIKGECKNVEDIYTFYKNMKDSLINTQLRLHKLQMKSQSVDDAVTIDPNSPSDYLFEITNMSAAEVNPKPAKETAKEEKQPAEDENKKNEQPAPSKPLLNMGKN